MIWVVYGGLLLLYWHSPGFSKHLALLMEGRMEARVGDPWTITSGWLKFQTLSSDRSLQSHRPCRSSLFNWRQDLHRTTLRTCNSKFAQPSSIIQIYPKNARMREWAKNGTPFYPQKHPETNRSDWKRDLGTSLAHFYSGLSGAGVPGSIPQ